MFFKPLLEERKRTEAAELQFKYSVRMVKGRIHRRFDEFAAKAFRVKK